MMSSPVPMEEDEDVAERAYASITAQLQQFTSSKLGTLPPRYDGAFGGHLDDDMDAMEWMERDLDVTSPPMKTPKKTPILERADTPVMSNSSSKKSKTPRHSKSPAAIPRAVVRSPRPVAPTSGHQSPFVYRRYHDALLTYLKAKRSLSHSLELEQQGQALETMTLGPSVSPLSGRELRAEVEFLSQLQQLCWSSTSSLEGDFWLLLVSLRQLGLSALVWDDDHTSQAQYSHAIHGFIQQLATRVDDSPADILQRLVSNEAPLALQRRFAVLQWIQTCLDQVRVQPRTSLSRKSTSHPDDLPSLVPEDSDFLEASLGLILAGRLGEAQELARSRGQPWRAAVWGGGKPLGTKKIPNSATQVLDMQSTGNPHRFSWKRQIWKNARRAQPLEAAISAVLADDVMTALSNPHLRSWSQAIAVVFSGMWGRLEDEVLAQHNTQRRKESLPHEGTQHTQKEQEQLMATLQLAGLTEAKAMALLQSSRFEEICAQGVYEDAMTAFLMGKSAVLDYCKREAEFVFGEDNDEDAQLAHLRFLTHLLLFLESLQVSTTPVDLGGLTHTKNRVLFQYVQYLESRPELWQHITLYVSLLPENKLVEWYPSMLAKVLEDTERRNMLESMQTLFPHLVMQILQKTVRLCLNSHAAPDEIKIQSIHWLLMDETYHEEALVCSNILLREFFLDDNDKLDLAMALTDETLPEGFAEQYAAGNVRAEHMAFLSYLDAYRTFCRWKDSIATTRTTVKDTASIDMNNLTSAEQEIANQRLEREWARQKRKDCENLIQTAEQTRSVLLDVLTYPGGWLSVDEVEPVFGEEGTKRRNDLAAIRSRYLVLAVSLYHQVCEETAAWLSRSIEDSAPFMTRAEALKSLQEQRFQPEIWYQHALDLAITIADDQYGICSSFGANALKDVLTKLAETAVLKLMCSKVAYPRM